MCLVLHSFRDGVETLNAAADDVTGVVADKQMIGDNNPEYLYYRHASYIWPCIGGALSCRPNVRLLSVKTISAVCSVEFQISYLDPMCDEVIELDFCGLLTLQAGITM